MITIEKCPLLFYISLHLDYYVFYFRSKKGNTWLIQYTLIKFKYTRKSKSLQLAGGKISAYHTFYQINRFCVKGIVKILRIMNCCCDFSGWQTFHFVDQVKRIVRTNVKWT